MPGWTSSAGSKSGIRTTVEENRVFSGAGELCRRLTGWDPHILVLPTEIAKVYMDEREGILHEPLIGALGAGLRRAIAAHPAGKTVKDLLPAEPVFPAHRLQPGFHSRDLPGALRGKSHRHLTWGNP